MSTWGQGWLWELAFRDHGGRPKGNTGLHPLRALVQLRRKINKGLGSAINFPEDGTTGPR